MGLLLDGFSDVSPIFSAWEIFTIEMFMTFTLVKCKYANVDSIYYFIYGGNSNVWHVCYRLRDNQTEIYKCSRFQFWSWKWRSRSLTIWMKMGGLTCPINLYTRAKIGRYRPSRLFPVIFYIYIYIHIYIYVYTQYTCTIAWHHSTTF